MAYVETPILYEQGGLCYYEEASSFLTTSTSTVDIRLFEAEATTSYSNSDEVVFVSAECECVRYIREVLGVNIKGDAHTIKSNTDIPIKGGVVLLNYDGIAHVAYVKEVLLDRFIIQESNFKKCTPTERVIKKNDVHITGYYFRNPNMVN